MVIGGTFKMANVLAKNSGAWHIVLATPIKLVGSLNLGIKLGIFFDTPLEVDTPMVLGMLSFNTNDCGKCT